MSPLPPRCEACKRRGQNCDGTQPCSTCEQNAGSCTYKAFDAVSTNTSELRELHPMPLDLTPDLSSIRHTYLFSNSSRNEKPRPRHTIKPYTPDKKDSEDDSCVKEYRKEGFSDSKSRSIGGSQAAKHDGGLSSGGASEFEVSSTSSSAPKDRFNRSLRRIERKDYRIPTLGEPWETRHSPSFGKRRKPVMERRRSVTVSPSSQASRCPQKVTRRVLNVSGSSSQDSESDEHESDSPRPSRGKFPRWRLGAQDLKGKPKSYWAPRSSDVNNNMERLLDPLINAEIEGDASFRNTARMKKYGQYLFLKRNVQPTSPLDEEEGAQLPVDLVNRAIVKGRAFLPLQRRPADHGAATLPLTMLHFQDAGMPKKGDVPASDPKPVFRFFVSSRDLDEVQLDEIEILICNILNRIPERLDSQPPNSVLQKGMILKTAVDAMFQDRGEDVDTATITGIVFTKRGGPSKGPQRLEYRAQVKFFDPDGSIDQFMLHVDTARVNMDVLPRPIPDWIEVQSVNIPKTVSVSEHPKHTRAIEHLRYLIWTLRGRIMTKKQVQAFQGSYLNTCCLYEGVPGGRGGLYEGKQPFTIDRQGQAFITRIGASRAALQDITSTNPKKPAFKLPQHRVYSIAHSRIAKVLSKWIESWKGSDFLAGWIEAAHAADAINIQIDEAEVTDLGCNCLDSQKSHTLHDCNICGLLTPCADLEFSEEFGLMCCNRCILRESKKELRGKPRMMHMIRQYAASELERGGRGVFDELLADLLGSPYWLDWNNYRDAYSSSDQPAPGVTWQGKVRSFAHLERGRIASPFTPSIDAARPFFLTSAGKTGVHVPGNLLPTSRWLNLAQNIFVKATTPVLAEYVRGEDDSAFDRAQWDEKIREIHMLAVSVPYRAAKRIGNSKSDNEFADCEAEWRTLCLRPTAKAWCFFSGRFYTSWLLCNSRFVQQDTPETIFLICLWSYCTDSKGHNRLLKLPINTWRKSPIRASIGRIEPGRALFSGWASNPKSMKDWNRARCNMILETCYENWAKSNFHAEHFPQIRKEFLEVVIPRDLYDPQACPRRTYTEPAQADGTSVEDEIEETEDDQEAWTYSEMALVSHLGGFRQDLHRVSICQDETQGNDDHIIAQGTPTGGGEYNERQLARLLVQGAFDDTKMVRFEINQAQQENEELRQLLRQHGIDDSIVSHRQSRLADLPEDPKGRRFFNNLSSSNREAANDLLGPVLGGTPDETRALHSSESKLDGTAQAASLQTSAPTVKQPKRQGYTAQQNRYLEKLKRQDRDLLELPVRKGVDVIVEECRRMMRQRKGSPGSFHEKAARVSEGIEQGAARTIAEVHDASSLRALLDPSCSPPPERWVQIVHTSSRTIRRGTAAKAAPMGTRCEPLRSVVYRMRHVRYRNSSILRRLELVAYCRSSASDRAGSAVLPPEVPIVLRVASPKIRLAVSQSRALEDHLLRIKTLLPLTEASVCYEILESSRSARAAAQSMLTAFRRGAHLLVSLQQILTSPEAVATQQVQEVEGSFGSFLYFRGSSSLWRNRRRIRHYEPIQLLTNDIMESIQDLVVVLERVAVYRENCVCSVVDISTSATCQQATWTTLLPARWHHLLAGCTGCPPKSEVLTPSRTLDQFSLADRLARVTGYRLYARSRRHLIAVNSGPRRGMPQDRSLVGAEQAASVCCIMWPTSIYDSPATHTSRAVASFGIAWNVNTLIQLILSNADGNPATGLISYAFPALKSWTAP
ncbi:hypothetical protein FH972_021934 [Carpinus fangiana]|uniref:Zn(2)-C6 fungal-type domain-containing protein n=1 Tax=Carpinus fangiana TaxID=176857 RepID=A0A5N6KQS4_9ROSI|nr:hypothetical protein FH972_021934 [Carpinus fangiana]